MSHKFKIGQRVRQARRPSSVDSGSAASSIFEIVRLMPEERSGEPAYRVKSAAGERAVLEGELTLAS
ncbi:hypothetical protein [Methylobacterium oxalidis]|uniref:Hypervirulence associated protein TUDOR domain-containing protein n=1 Tax=Methylobacterium oxalidis TaxID=944322 RepID=A0A512JDN7_9HYPH|nr:hypothetical protein [Methylobacterium oxalidis]GEP08055.1 hypothetical protein MOX02_60930 [Methylobacterium oxalidis]GJE35869.1 hypothetical protein LDDCCGHA_6090 [Methylobacterium oxalidis]GLS64901.1 hypothetical protein GCM10007888_32820 [Methylobacterium oxalidis]